MSIRPPDDLDPADLERERAGEMDGVDDAALTALQADLLAAAPQLAPDDGAPRVAEPDLDADDFDAGRLAAWARGEITGAEAEVIAAQLAESPARRALLAHLSEPVPPALTARMVSEAAPRRRRAPMIAGAVTLLALAAALVVFLQPKLPPPPPGFEAPRLGGGVAPVKSEPSGGTCFVPDSQLTLRLVPRATIEGALAGRVFQSAPPGSALAPLPSEHLEQKPGGAFVLAARAGDLFGQDFGPRALYVGVAVAAGPLNDAVGEAPPEANPDVAVDGVRWHAVELTYDAQCATP